MKTKKKLAPIKICTVKRIPETKLVKLKEFLPDIKTKKNKYNYDIDGLLHTCYVILNLVNHKFYIGKHSFNYDPKIVKYSFYHGSNKHLRNSMRKYGTPNFRMLILKYFRTPEKALEYETKIISPEMIKSKCCYNIQGGGKAFACGDKHHGKRKKFKRFLSKMAKQQVRDGRCAFSKRPDGTSFTSERHKDENWINPFKLRKDGSSVAKDRVVSGTHHFLTREDGTNINTDRILKGTHHLVGKEDYPWYSFRGSSISRLTWYFSDRLLNRLIKYPHKKETTLATWINRKYEIENNFGRKLSIGSIRAVLFKINSGWSPTEDTNWLDFKCRYNPKMDVIN